MLDRAFKMLSHVYSHIDLLECIHSVKMDSISHLTSFSALLYIYFPSAYLNPMFFSMTKRKNKRSMKLLKL